MPYLQGIKQRSRHAHMQATVRSLRDQQSARERESVRANAMHVSVRSTALLRERESERETATARVSTMFGPLRYSPCSAVQFERRSREVDRTQPLTKFPLRFFRSFLRVCFVLIYLFFFGVFLLLWIYLYISVDDA